MLAQRIRTSAASTKSLALHKSMSQKGTPLIPAQGGACRAVSAPGTRYAMHFIRRGAIQPLRRTPPAFTAGGRNLVIGQALHRQTPPRKMPKPSQARSELKVKSRSLDLRIGLCKTLSRA